MRSVEVWESVTGVPGGAKATAAYTRCFSSDPNQHVLDGISSL